MSLNILAIGCHADDIEIGCGGTLLTLLDAVPNATVTWVVLTANSERSREARQSASAFLGETSSRIQILNFPDAHLPYVGADVKAVFERLKIADPDVIFTHARDDRHQDHRVASDLTYNTFRDHLILEYEIPKVDGDLGRPNLFVPLSPSIATAKVELLMEHFPSQQHRHWFDRETFRGLMRLRGVEANTRYAEAFTVRKLVIDLWSEALTALVS